MTKGIGQISEVKEWKPFQYNGEVYHLDHLDAHFVEYKFDLDDPQRHYKVIVTYSFHCFAKDYDHYTDDERQGLLYHAPKESRPFNFERYNYSKNMRKIIEELHQREDCIIGYAGYDNYAVFTYQTKSGEKHQYKIAFNVFTEKKKLRMHISSAYLNDNLEDPKKMKVNFEAILKNVRLNKKPPKPRGYK
ncbi:stationary phase growth adaptation protein [Thiomicrospira aerophila AL3]|uniref:Stationary phase growth adaptation protein n=1 Tax=Thiomicrospira aerophila AL3 TaxID=717772 RepID=W0DWN1_9GAMM|nr:hypothetical protein [Thiomicrospira aerophila]AHF01404.1 stationary phase growth adaptation protein [Thiomicrospira aerophila AL3]